MTSVVNQGTKRTIAVRSLVGVLAFSAFMLVILQAIGPALAYRSDAPRDLDEYSDVPPGAGSRPVDVVEDGDDYRLVRHVAGTSRVPAAPRRICALSSADEVLSLGVMPVAHSIADGNFPDYLKEPFRDVPWIPNVFGSNMPNMEAVISVNPDLIITRSPSRQTYEQLSRIAPVVVLLDHLDNYRQRVLDVGAIIGKRKEAEARVAWYNAKVAAARKAIHEKLRGRSVALLRIRPTSYRLYGDQRHVSPVLYRDLGIRRPKLVEDRHWSATVSPEGLLTLDADYMILAADTTTGSQRNMDALLSHPIWQRVPAVKSRQVLVIPKYRHWADAGILGRGRAVDDVVKAVAPRSLEEVNASADSAWRRALP
ncbi:putative siderophore-binding lipoprotein YfiY precursor [Planctomycetes bacterium Pan216]|uniref:Putative siderophore-binding lipoprotein YfiY n=1 Tax=Kolteria novifilia TaxID=2527975 RepID=A0A518AZY2_9BACT|nr:putative siderophore-binding lipoprotein YfiY precursor [Planctomycetes bacterium Pan216]